MWYKLKFVTAASDVSCHRQEVKSVEKKKKEKPTLVMQYLLKLSPVCSSVLRWNPVLEAVSSFVLCGDEDVPPLLYRILANESFRNFF